VPRGSRVTSPRRASRLLSAWGLALLAPLWLAASVAGQEGQGRGEGSLVVHVYAFEHQPASEAMPLVLGLLSSDGTVELRPGSNTLVIRDSLASVSRIVPLLRSFDHPARRVEVSLWLVAGGPGPVVSPQVAGKSPPAELLAQLRRHLPYAAYELLAASEVRGLEGDRVDFELPSGHSVRFRLGTVLGDQRVRLQGFEVSRRSGDPEGERLVRGNLNLWLERTTVLSMANSRDESRALMVVVRCRLTTEEPGS
jgi:hypothetical protein